MSIFQKVTLEILKKNKVRTMVTIIGVILSASMITAVTTSISSLQNYMLQNAIYTFGDWHASALEADAGVFDMLEESGKVESYVYNQKIGYAIAEGCTNEYKPYLYIIGADNKFMENMPVHLTGGRLPKTSEEILLPEHLATNGEVHYKVGDVLTLEIGERVSDGYILGQNNPYMKAEESEEASQNEAAKETQSQTENGGLAQNEDNPQNEINEGTQEQTGNELEWLEVKETRIYTVVGFYERPNFEGYSAPGYTAITTMDKVRAENAMFDVYYKMTDPQETYGFFSALGYGSETNSGVLTYLGAWGYNGFYGILYGLAGIIIGLIMFGSISLIYNAFSISVSERTKQFGLLSSIGATKKQLRNMVLFEGMMVSAIGIPLGILAGVGGMGVTFHFVGKEFSAITNYMVPLTLCVYPWIIAAACVITFVTVMISAWIPSKRATMVTAVEAIRQSSDIKEQKRRKKKGTCENGFVSSNQFMEQLIYRLFGLSGMIADKYYRRSRKKYRATIVSLFMSIVLFVSASAFTNYFTDMVEAGYEGNNYDISYDYDPTEYMGVEEVQNEDFSNVISQEELAKLFANAACVTESAYAGRYVTRIKLENQYISEEYLTYQAEKSKVTGVEMPEGYTEIYLGINFVDDASYEAFLEEQKLEKEIYMNPESLVGIAFDGRSDFDYELEKIVTKNVLKAEGSKIAISHKENAIELEIGRILYERPYFIYDWYDVVLAYPYSKMDMVLQDIEGQSHMASHFIKSEDHEKSFEAMKNMIVENGLSKRNLYSMAEAMEENRSLIFVINVFAYGFIVLISLIAAANVFNTISTNISLRRREFAMLKSVGMSNKELNRMMNFECVLYGSRALLYGIPVSAAITWLIYKVVSDGYTAGFYLPWGAIGIAVCSVFLVVFATMMYSMRKIKADNPIDALKNDNV
uniref:ABC transporter permease n=1 Tax=Agathobacter sp. TaxID=2021311 RepID=UPI0040569641